MGDEFPHPCFVECRETTKGSDVWNVICHQHGQIAALIRGRGIADIFAVEHHALVKDPLRG